MAKNIKNLPQMTIKRKKKQCILYDVSNNEERVSGNCDTCKHGHKHLGQKPCINCFWSSEYEQLTDC